MGNASVTQEKVMTRNSYDDVFIMPDFRCEYKFEIGFVEFRLRILCKSTLGGLEKLFPSGLANVGRTFAYLHCAEVFCTSGYGWSGHFNFHFLFTLPAKVLGS